MGGGARRLDAAALVDGHVDDDGTLLHTRDHLLGHQLGSGSAGNQDCADQQVSFFGSLRDRISIRCLRAQVTVKDVVEFAETIKVHIDNGDVGAEAEGHLRSVRSYDAAPDDDNVGRRNTGDTAEQDAASTFFFFQITRADLDRHSACNF